MIFLERVWYKPCYAIYFRPGVLKTYVIIFLAETYVTATTTSRTNRSFHRTCPSFKANPLANYFQIGVTGRDSVGAQFKKKHANLPLRWRRFSHIFCCLKNEGSIPGTRYPPTSFKWMETTKSYQNSPRICGRLSSFLYRRQFPLFLRM